MLGFSQHFFKFCHQLQLVVLMQRTRQPALAGLFLLSREARLKLGIKTIFQVLKISNPVAGNRP